jgi:hypothetical protein
MVTNIMRKSHLDVEIPWLLMVRLPYVAMMGHGIITDYLLVEVCVFS